MIPSYVENMLRTDALNVGAYNPSIPLPDGEIRTETLTANSITTDEMNITGDEHIQGSLTVDGDVTIGGSILEVEDIEANGIIETRALRIPLATDGPAKLYVDEFGDGKINSLRAGPNSTVTITPANVGALTGSAAGIQLIAPLGANLIPIVRHLIVQYRSIGGGSSFTVPTDEEDNPAKLLFGFGEYNISNEFSNLDAWLGDTIELHNLVDRANNINYMAYLSNPNLVDDLANDDSRNAFPVGNLDPAVCSLIAGTNSENDLISVNGGGSITVSVWYDVLDLTKTS